MVDFISSFKKGLSAAQQAEENRKEIYSVLAELNEQLSKATEGKLKISVYERPELLSNFLAITGGQPKIAYTFLGAINPLAESTIASELAKWKLDPNGYPCQINTADYELYCEDKAALERGLKDLISHPAVGEKMYSVMKQKLQPSDS